MSCELTLEVLYIGYWDHEPLAGLVPPGRDGRKPISRKRRAERLAGS